MRPLDPCPGCGTDVFEDHLPNCPVLADQLFLAGVPPSPDALDLRHGDLHGRLLNPDEEGPEVHGYATDPIP